MFIQCSLHATMHFLAQGSPTLNACLGTVTNNDTRNLRLIIILLLPVRRELPRQSTLQLKLWQTPARHLNFPPYGIPAHAACFHLPVRMQDRSLSSIHHIFMVRTTGSVEESCTGHPYVYPYGSCELRVPINSRLQYSKIFFLKGRREYQAPHRMKKEKRTTEYQFHSSTGCIHVPHLY